MTMDSHSIKSIPEFSPNTSSPLNREWGTEETLILASGKYMLRRLKMKAKTSGGMQMHHLKDESSYILSGVLKVNYIDFDGNPVEVLASAGEYFRFPTGCIHKVTCIEDAEILEVTTLHLNDRIRMDKKYGFDPSCCSLPTTDFDEIHYL